MSEQRNSFLRSAFILVERDKKSFSRSTYLNYRTALRAFARFGGQEVEHGRWLCVNKPLLYEIGKWGVRILKR